MNKLLERLQNRLMLSDEDTGGEGADANANANTDKSETANKEPVSTDQKQVYKYMHQGQVIELDEGQQAKVIALGLQKAQEMYEQQNKEPEKPKEQPKPKSETEALQARIDELEGKLVNKVEGDRNAQTINAVNAEISKGNFDDETANDLRQLALSRAALMMREKGYDPSQAAAAASKLVDKYQERLGISNNTDANEKLNDKEKMKHSTPAEKGASVEVPNYTRQSFKDGSLTKAIQELYSKATQ